jgi:ABC-type lipoprotein release transport system permease subunit
LITAALVVLLSAFNGIESMIEKLYSDFDPDITIRSSQGKTFPEEVVNFKLISKTEGVERMSRAVEEVVVIKHEKKWINATLIGVDTTFLEMSGLTTTKKGRFIHMVDGYPSLHAQGTDFGIIGATLLDKLGGFIPERDGFEQVTIFAPKREGKMRLGSNPFNSGSLYLSGRMNFNREVNAENLVVPLNVASDLLDYDGDLSAIYVEVHPNSDVEEVRSSLKKLLGNGFIVKTSYEKNELIFKTSKTEKLLVIVILIFIFILAAFNLVASITMLFIEKKDNIHTMIAFGMSRPMVFRIFFFEGLLICAKGIFFGVVLGYLVCYAQIGFSLLQMPNSNGEAFPVVPTWTDGALIILLVTLLSLIFSYLPVRFLIRKNFSEQSF